MSNVQVEAALLGATVKYPSSKQRMIKRNLPEVIFKFIYISSFFTAVLLL